MQLKINTDYAIRIVFFVAISQKRVSSVELSEKLGIPQSTVFKIGKKLSENGIVDITTGQSGGFILIKDPNEISLFEIINMFEPTSKLNRCLEEDEYCSRFATKNCPVRRVYINLQDVLEEHLKAVKFSELLK